MQKYKYRTRILHLKENNEYYHNKRATADKHE